MPSASPDMSPMHKMDAKDWRLLYELDLDASQSLAKIGKKLGMGRDVIHYRVKRLEREGIIRNYITIIDYGKLGYITGVTCIKLQHDTPKIQQEIIAYFKKNPMVWWFGSRDGNYDLVFAFWAEDLVKLKELQNELLKKYRACFHSIKTRIYHSLTHFPRAYLVPGERRKTEGTFITQEAHKITDAYDDALLQQIAENARSGYTDIANQLKLSAAQVHYRLQQLKKKKVILGSRAVIDLGKLGYSRYNLDIYLDDYSALLEIKKSIAKYPNAVYLYDTLGGADIDVEFEVKSESQMQDIENKLKEKFASAIRYTARYKFTKVHKLIYFPGQ